jgi:hypothetical protein
LKLKLYFRNSVFDNDSNKTITKSILLFTLFPLVFTVFYARRRLRKINTSGNQGKTIVHWTEDMNIQIRHPLAQFMY